VAEDHSLSQLNSKETPMATRPILVAGQWRDACHSATFTAANPATKQALPDEYPISDWADCDACLDAAVAAAAALRRMPVERIAQFLERFAERIESQVEPLVNMAHDETALPKSPRLANVELPRTTNQLRQAAAAARDGSWVRATIDTKAGIRSMFGPLGPICVFGPNNFPFAFGSISGGDFAAAIAAGNPVIAKANSSHPGTTRLFAEQAQFAADETEMPAGTVQLLYRLRHEDGDRLVSDPRVGGTGYTGSRSAGLSLKTAADAAGKPIYLELSSVNPVVVLPGALDERAEEIAEEFTTSCLMGTGQFCTNPGMVVLIDGRPADGFIEAVSKRFRAAPAGTLLSEAVAIKLRQNLQELHSAGAELITGNQPDALVGVGHSHPNSLLRVSAKQFLRHPAKLQVEAFGNASLFVVAADVEQACAVIDQLEGNLTGCIYSAKSGQDDAAYDQVAATLRSRVGRLLNDKMPTGVAVSPAMNHGGPYPATGHPGFTAVGIPASISRFAMLHCYDNVRPHRLPPALQDKNPTGKMWRLVDGAWTQADV
jgi:NADP-dependent aldehyde dehydrogenase